MHCPKCSKEISRGELKCPHCHQTIKAPVAIIAVSIIQFVMGGLACLSGLMLMVIIRKPKILEQALKRVFDEFAKAGRSFPGELNQPVIIKFAIILSAVMIIWGIFDIVVGWGLRNLKKWAGILAVASAVLGILVGFGRDITGFILNLVVIILIVYGWNSLS